MHSKGDEKRYKRDKQREGADIFTKTMNNLASAVTGNKEEEPKSMREKARDLYEDKKDHLNLYNEVDIALDTFPYNGVTTSFEAIWMGVPVLTMAGYNFNSRCGESINKNLNMEQLIAKDEDDYIQKVVNLTNNTDDYINIRNSIFIDSIKSPLFNIKDYSKSFFEALEGIAK